MRMASLLLVLLSGAPMCDAHAAPTPHRWVRCCLELDLPDAPPGPVCAQVRRRGGLRARRLCRLLGGRPIGRGDCSIAACRAPA